MAGGSRGGSAASFSAGLAAAALGTDTNGSIRVPGRILRGGGVQANVGTTSLTRQTEVREIDVLELTWA
jgi:aspartyl-tRNA(Asn)/glutamyl-tRNA(Gln) amidotransferase subunit A